VICYNVAITNYTTKGKNKRQIQKARDSQQTFSFNGNTTKAYHICIKESKKYCKLKYCKLCFSQWLRTNAMQDMIHLPSYKHTKTNVTRQSTNGVGGFAHEQRCGGVQANSTQ